MNSFLFLAGRIRAKEGDLLTMGQAERMIGAVSVEAAFRVLVELPYAEFIDKETSVSSFLDIINQGLIETKNLLIDGTGNDLALDFIWKEFDVNNLKRALKEKLIESRTEIGVFDEGNGYAPFGSLSAEQLSSLVFFQDEGEVDFPLIYKDALLEAVLIYEERKNFQLVEFLLDRVHFEYLMSLANQLKNSFLKEYISVLADECNTKTLLRFILSGEDLVPESFVAYGSFSKAVFMASDVSDIDSFVSFLVDTDLLYLVDDCRAYVKNNGESHFLAFYERLLDKHKQSFLINSEAGEIESIQIPMVYFMRRVQNSRILKFIMFAKMYGLPSEEIYASLKNLFHFEG